MVRTESSSFLTWGNQVKKYRKRNFHLLLSEFRSGNFAKFRHIMHPWLRLYPQVKIPIHKKVTSLSLLGVSTPIFGVTFRRFGASFPRSCAQMGRTWVRRFSDYGSYLNNHPIFLKVSDMESSWSQTYGTSKNFSFLTLSVPLLFFFRDPRNPFWPCPRPKRLPFPRSCAQTRRTWVRRVLDFDSYLNNHPIFLKVLVMESSWSQTYGTLKNFSFLTLSVPLLFFSGTRATPILAVPTPKTASFSAVSRPNGTHLGPSSFIFRFVP
jgi:hypothetical protein